MDKLPQIIADYFNVSNNYDTQGYLATFSDDALIKEESLGKILVGKRKFSRNLFYQTQTEVIEYKVSQNTINMKVLFTRNFPGEEINGLFKFTLNPSGFIANLEADLE